LKKDVGCDHAEGSGITQKKVVAGVPFSSAVITLIFGSIQVGDTVG
jgi:hypothetical protein